MKLSQTITRILLCLALSTNFSVLAANSNAFDFNAQLGSGINLANALEAPVEGDWGVTLQPEYFQLVKSAGFNHVRIPIRWSAHALSTAPYTIDENFFQRIDWVVKQSLANSLLVVINMHHYEQLESAPDTQRARFIEMWRQISQRYKNTSPYVAFEIYNEPANAINESKWNELFADTLKVVRESNPHRVVIVGPVNWNNINKLPGLKVPDNDRDLVVTVHYYEPFHFTHQGASWVGQDSKSWLGTKWLDNSAERSNLSNDFNKAYVWAASNHRPIYIGEFGAIAQADMDSRARWTRAVRQEAISRSFSTAYWEFCSNFGVYDVSNKQWRLPLLNALTSR